MGANGVGLLVSDISEDFSYSASKTRSSDELDDSGLPHAYIKRENKIYRSDEYTRLWNTDYL